MPTMLCYVLCLTSVSGFESHSLRHVIETKTVALDSGPTLRDAFPLWSD
jgi:hypothetical protein